MKIRLSTKLLIAYGLITLIATIGFTYYLTTVEVELPPDEVEVKEYIDEDGNTVREETMIIHVGFGKIETVTSKDVIMADENIDNEK